MTSEPRTCPMPGCGGELATSEWGDLACPTCGAAGPEAVIDAIAFNHRQLDAALAEVERLKARGAELEADVDHLKRAAETAYDRGKVDALKQPERVLAEAGRLLAEAGATTGLPGGFALRRESDFQRFEGASLAEAYAQLTGAHVAAPKGTGT